MNYSSFLAPCSICLLLLTSCGAPTQEEKLAHVITESVCIAQDARNIVMKAVVDNNIDFSNLQNKTDEMQKKMQEVLKENFKSEQEIRSIYEQIPMKEEFEKKVKETIMSKCKADEGTLQRVMDSITGKKTETNSNTNATTNTNSPFIEKTVTK